ncbi:DciA family protein [Streptomyces sp. NBC_00654]|uniref:DciA family protein n=1 Tax=Streptomyces sp. NBC_00654 TaxID=2975799 RepID=UPI002259CDAA|nr:DciA family protein [Streptomyces sp. NBC_00654]MCX4970819.1 DciA family protein [Streptomyces sp. NBC_00654]
MTTTTPSNGVPGSSGVDLARVALRNARAAAKTQPQPKRRTGASPSGRPRTGGRDPLPFGDALARMVAERGWEQAAAGGNVLDQWPTIAPELTGKVTAVRFDTQTRTLHLLPCSPAYRTQLTLHQKQITAKINDTVGPDTVRHLEILRPATLTTPHHAPPVPSAARTPAPAATPHPVAVSGKSARQEVPEGYRDAIAAHRATWNTTRQHTSPEVQAAAERQLRNRLREPEENFADGRQALAGLRAKAAAQQQVRPSDASRARALQRLAAEREGLATLTPTSALNPARPSQAA